MKIRQKIGRALALTALSAGMIVASSGPASAAPDCYIIKYITYGSGIVFAGSETYCESTGIGTPRYIEIKRQNANGTMTLLRSGMGDISYHCTGSTTNTYWTNGSTIPRDRARSVVAPCS